MSFGLTSFSEAPFGAIPKGSEAVILTGQSAQFNTGTLILGGHSSVTLNGVSALFKTGAFTVVGRWRKRYL